MAEENHIAPVVSHGRGGQGNIAPDSTKYTDAEITRQGAEGDQGDGAYSAGRGGAGNINSSHIPPSTGPGHDSDTIPSVAVRPVPEGEFHVGRGGQGNVNTNIQTHVKVDAEAEAEANGHGEESKGPAMVSGGNEGGGTPAPLTERGPDTKPDVEKRKSFVEEWTESLKGKIFGRK